MHAIHFLQAITLAGLTLMSSLVRPGRAACRRTVCASSPISDCLARCIETFCQILTSMMYVLAVCRAQRASQTPKGRDDEAAHPISKASRQTKRGQQYLFDVDRYACRTLVAGPLVQEKLLEGVGTAIRHHVRHLVSVLVSPALPHTKATE